MNSNPLDYRVGVPPFDRIEISHMQPAVEAVLKWAADTFDSVEETIKKNSNAGKLFHWDQVMVLLDDIDDRIHRVWGPISHLFGVQNSPELRTVYETCQPKLVELGLRMSQSKIVYDGILSLMQDQKSWDILPRARQRIIEQKVLSAKLSGIALEGSQKERFNQISQKLAELQMKFSNHVLDSTKAWSMTLTDAGEVSGLSERVKDLASQDWLQANPGKVQNPAGGPWRFSLDMPSYVPFMEFSERQDLRERMYRARMLIASAGATDNSPLIDEILKLRTEKAQILGFKTFAELSLASKMAEDINAVEQLLMQLRESSYKIGLREHQDLQEFSARHGGTRHLNEWDVPYWARRLKEETFNFNEDDLRPYFPMPKVLAGLFELVHRLFAIRVETADDAVATWHSDVRFFKIFDESTNGHIASFYLDPYSRPSNKRGGAWMADSVNRRRSETGLEIPVAYLICNGTPPMGEKPSLMAFSEVQTLFHEFGHGLQHMLSTVDELAVSGISGVEWDAVELASQFMENWLYHEPTLKGVSGHYVTGEPLPQHFMDKIVATKNFRAATGMLRQLQFALTDMELHHHYSGAGESPHEVAMRIAKLTSPLPPRPESRQLCSFTHIFSGGYSAGYYSYKWAEVLSADAFSAFEEAGLDKKDRMRDVGRLYRDTILAMGGGEHPMEVFQKFRGRPPSTEPLLRHYGLVVKG